METLRHKVRTPKNRYWTLVVIPASQEKVKNLKLPCWILHGILVLSIMAILTGLYFHSSYQSLRADIVILEDLRATNHLQEQEILRLKQQAQEMQQKIHAVEVLDRQVREMVGLKNNPSPGPTTQLASRSAQGSGMEERETRRALIASGGDMNTTIAREAAMQAEQSSLQSEGLRDLAQIEHMFVEIKTQTDYQIYNLEKLQEEVAARMHYLEAKPDHWPLEGRISSRFGMRRSPFGNYREFHDGIDIVGRRGTVITSAGAGTVIFRGWRTGFGLTVIIDHGYGYATLYGHNSSIMVRVGQSVDKGDPIARVGSTGRSTGPHLHFTIFRNGRPIDPMKILE
jgi:murein DD-endopeptidase MepM/ murein hydrolase activator NlpD